MRCLVRGQALRAREEARGGVRERGQDAGVLHAHALLRLARHQRQRRQDVPARAQGFLRALGFPLRSSGWGWPLPGWARTAHSMRTLPSALSGTSGSTGRMYLRAGCAEGFKSVRPATAGLE